MSSMNLKRIQREFMDLMKENNVFNIEVLSTTELVATIQGPPDSPYVDGRFNIGIRLPESYPLRPPQVRFLTLVWHPNILSETGDICLDILDSKWSPIHSIRTILLSLQGLLESPEPTDPLNAVVAQQYLENYDTFVKTAEHWTNVYADGPHVHADYNEMVEKFKKLAGSETRARSLLSCADWDMKMAARILF